MVLFNLLDEEERAMVQEEVEQMRHVELVRLVISLHMQLRQAHHALKHLSAEYDEMHDYKNYLRDKYVRGMTFNDKDLSWSEDLRSN